MHETNTLYKLKILNEGVVTLKKIENIYLILFVYMKNLNAMSN